jgi:hypothetical protein
LATEQNLTLVDATLLATLRRRYWPERPMEANFLNYYSVCVMATKLAAQ